MKKTPLRRHRLRTAPVLLALLIGLVAVPAAAETTITPSLTLSEEYTDNVDGVATGERDDFITVVSPGIRIDVLEQRYRASLGYTPGFAFHHRESEDDYVRHNADALFAAQLSQQTELTLTDRYTRTNEPRTDTFDADEIYGEWIDPTLRRGRETWYSNTAAVSLNHRFGKEDSFGIGYRHRMLENDDPRLEDSQRHTPWASLTHWFNPSFGLGTDVSYERGLFEYDDPDLIGSENDDLKQYRGTVKGIHRIDRHFQWYLRYTHTKVDYDGFTPDYTIYDPGVGFVWDIAEGTSLDFDIGYFFQDRDRLDEESGLSFRGNLNKRWKKGTLRLSAESGYEEASYGAENLGLDLYYQASVRGTYDLTRALSLTADAAYRYNEYVNSIPQREDDVYNTAIGLNYKPAAWRWMILSLTGRRYDVQSTDARNDLTENSVMLSISLTPMTPYRFD
jgi:hypothetical protein